MGQDDTLYEADDAPQEEPTRARVVPFSCSTNLSNDVLSALRKAKLRADALNVCLYMHRQTFGNAGFHRKRRQSEVWCDYKHAVWAREVPCDKGNLSRIIRRLEACRIVVWQGGDRASGRIGWNVDVTLWQRYGAPGGARPGAGRPRREEINTTTPPASDSGLHGNQNDNRNNSIRQQKEFNMTTATASESAIVAARGPAEEWEESEETLPNGNGRGATRAPAPAPIPSTPSPLPATVSPSDEATQTLAPPIARRPPTRTRTRKLSDEQLAVHNAKAQYIRLLVEALSRAFGGELPTPPKQRQGAEWFYTLKDGPAPIEDVVACFEATLPDPYYETAPPSTHQLQGRYAAWLKDREKYRKNVLAKAARTKAATEGKQGARAAPAAPSFAPASDYRA